jgi:predicted permease
MSEFGKIILEVIGVTLPIFAVVAIGFFIRRKGFIKAEHVPVLNKLTYNLGLSALVFRVISGSKFSDIVDVSLLKVVYSTYFLFILIIFLSFYFTRLNGGLKGAIIVSSYRNNMAFIGMPVLLYAFGSLAAAKAGIVIAALLPLNIISTALFLQFIKAGSGGSAKISALSILRAIFTDPVIIATAAGLLISYFNIRIPGPIDNLFEILASIAVPLALLSIGASFKFSHIKENVKFLSILNVLKLIVFPGIALLFGLYVFNIAEFDRNIICILFATPVAVATYIQAARYKTDHDFISSAIITTTIVSALTLSVWLFILKLI